MINESALMQERRMEVRYSLNGLVPLKLMIDDKILDAIFLDVSSRGLGLIVEPSLKVDQTVNLKVSGSLTIPVSVRWIKKPIGLTAPGVPIFHRAGVCLINEPNRGQVNILEVLEHLHCVDH